MNNSIKAIDTVYKGYKFRSRLEARWAVYFDSLNIKWLYEPEGYKLSNGEMYLPDFFLPDSNTYVEIKPDNYNGSDDKKHSLFADEIKATIVINKGIPGDHPSKTFRSPNTLLAKSIKRNGPEPLLDWNNIKRAIAAAKSARFEHNK